MRKVARSELLDWMTYAERREAMRPEALRAKESRRVQVGEYLTFLFENHTTIRYQVQEMMRAERIVREADIQHELDTYNALLGARGELGCTLLVGVEDPAERDHKLRRWLALPEHVYVKLEGGERVRALVDEAQRSTERLSSVQYLKFPLQGRVPLAVGCDLAGLAAETELDPVTRAALRADLAEP